MKKRNINPKAENIEKWQSADESSLIREQERQARERKRKKYRRKKQIAAVIVIALLAGGIWYAGWGRTLLAADTEETVAIQVGPGQQVIYAQLTAVRGNEITYTVAKAIDTEEVQGDSDQTTGGAGSQMPWGQGGQMPGGMSGQRGTAQSQRREGGSNGGEGWMQQSFPQGQSRGSTAQGGFSGGEFPGGGFPGGGQSGGFPGGEQQGGSFPNGGFDDFGSGFGGSFGGYGAGMGNGSMGSTGSSADTGFTYNNVTYRLTQESVTTQIPVGTQVTTRLGTVTTFSRLAAGDRIALVVEEEAGTQIIMAVYIIG